MKTLLLGIMLIVSSASYAQVHNQIQLLVAPQRDLPANLGRPIGNQVQAERKAGAPPAI